MYTIKHSCPALAFACLFFIGLAMPARAAEKSASPAKVPIILDGKLARDHAASARRITATGRLFLDKRGLRPHFHVSQASASTRPGSGARQACWCRSGRSTTAGT